MHVRYLFLICALAVNNVHCDCDQYIECFGDFLRDFFGNIHFVQTDKVNVTNSNKTLNYEFSEPEDASIDKVLSDLTSLIKQIDGNIKESEVLIHDQNNTKIVVRTFELDDSVKNKEHIDSEDLILTTEINLAEDISFKDLTVTTPSESPTTEDAFKVIPLESKSEKDNEINDDIDQSYEEADEKKYVTDYPDIDYIEIYKDTTNEHVSYQPTEANLFSESNELRSEINKQETEIENLLNHSLNLANEEALAEVVENVTNHNIQTSTTEDEILKGMAPWIATIFLKNETGSQFDYYCDGALVSDRAVLTAARCVSNATGSYSPESFIVILGKTSLRISGSQEKILRVQDVKTHVYFTIASSVAQNDLAVLTLEEPVLFNEGISKANLENMEINEEDGESSVSVTTAWGLSGDIALIYFDKEKSKACDSNNKVENTFCATYGDDVALCPSYGGLYVTKQANKLYLAGIRTGDPTDRGICFIKNVNYTSLKNNTQWVSENIDV
ncbi:uncharacterized protein LOC114355759 isoform X1 [Ostrinia furnacalis]|uniref:uncharacterized protein LOC114355759 isoform X1 n=1 Tax=Ostrinia furnacalis TaxID=93504 RepID=UPI00103A57CA|nr:uncharacterized protein LOC114355759 isoform X1 [Ostrinia furnacalis]